MSHDSEIELPPLAVGVASPGTATPGTPGPSAGMNEGDRGFFSRPPSPADHEEGRQEFSLPPVDGGKDAWLFLAACFAIEGLVWGFPFSFGVFQDYYNTHAPFAGSPSIAVIGTCSMGVMYLTAPIVIGGCRSVWSPRWTRLMPIAGLLIMCTALALSSLSTSVAHLIAVQGVVYGIGGSIAYCPCILYMDEWFVKRKGLAYGIMWAGTGLAGVVLPLLLESLLNGLGFRTTLRLWSGLLFALTAPLAWFIKPRVPPSSAGHARPFSLRFLANPTSLLYQLANVVEATGFFLPGIYLPTYARAALGAAPFTAATTVLAVNVASVFGSVAMGWLIDRFHVTTCILLSTIGTTAGVFLLWGLSSSLPLLYLFCVVYGLFAGSFTSAWPGIMMELTRKGESQTSSPGAGAGAGFVDPTMVFGWLAAGRGVGNLVSGPLSAGLTRGMPWKGETAAFGYGSEYGGLIVFTGVTAFLGGASWIWRRFGLL
ncbi:MFS general substrate transporter [Camillea tinctor]|nr:MFS general substrate transporter [Camillea tinctor]